MRRSMLRYVHEQHMTDISCASGRVVDMVHAGSGYSEEETGGDRGSQYEGADAGPNTAVVH